MVLLLGVVVAHTHCGVARGGGGIQGGGAGSVPGGSAGWGGEA